MDKKLGDRGKKYNDKDIMSQKGKLKCNTM